MSEGQPFESQTCQALTLILVHRVGIAVGGDLAPMVVPLSMVDRPASGQVLLAIQLPALEAGSPGNCGA